MTRKIYPTDKEGAIHRHPPQPRKLPMQPRAHALVEAVVEACLRILDSEGAQALTMQRLVEVSGVAPGSIYQYFPNMEAIVTLVYEHVLRNEVNQIKLSMPRSRISNMSLVEVLREIVANIIRVELRLFRLNTEFLLKYHGDFDVGFVYVNYVSMQEFIDATWMKFLRIYEREVTAPDWQSAAYLLGIGIAGLVRITLEDDPARLEQPEFQASLVNMAMGIIKPPPE